MTAMIVYIYILYYVCVLSFIIHVGDAVIALRVRRPRLSSSGPHAELPERP
jgi:hypothetical protein